MKNIFLFLNLAFLCSTVWSQEEKLHVSYTMEIGTTDPSQLEGLAMMGDTKMDMYFDGTKSRVITEMAFMKMTSISNLETNKRVMLMESQFMGQQAVTMDNTDTSSTEENPELTIDIMDEKKMIAGFECTKGMIRMDGNNLAVWFTKEISPINNKVHPAGRQIPGFPLEYEVMQQGIIMKYTPTSVSKDFKVDPNFFDTTIPPGFEELNMDALKKMGQGLGFGN